MHIIPFLLLSFLLPSTALAGIPVPPDRVVESCGKPSPSMAHIAKRPKEIGTTNNLRRKTGAFEVAPGKPIIIHGKLLDKNCVPVMGARIEAWQAGEKGTKASSGMAITNNLGEFTFLAVVPPDFKEGRVLEITIAPLELKKLKTALYLEGRGGGPAPLTAQQDTDALADKTLGTPYYITYVTTESQPYKKY